MSNHYGVANTNNHRGGGGGGGRNDHNNEPEDAEQKAAERNLIRRCIDYHGPAVIDVQNRLYYKSCRSSHVKNHYGNHLQPHSEYLRLMGMPTSTFSAPNPSTVYCTYLAHVTRAKNSTPIMCLSWTPGGRRLLTGNQDGEFTLWDGITFSFELIMSAHDVSFRSMAWSHNRNYLLTSDAGGNIKYWSPSIAPVKSIDSHNGQPIHGLSFSPSDTKFVSCGDDSKLRVWDWATASEERCLEGHGWDVKSVQWHPRSSVIASGSKDNLVKLWDPRSGTCLSTLYGHKNTVTRVAWNNNGNWLLSSSRDQLIKLYDIRTMKELASLKGHNKEVTSVAWHPTHESVLASGSMDGMICFWNLGAKGSDEPAARIPYAHDMAVWSLEWHPAGHMLASGSNDRQTKFWARNRVGSTAGLQDTSDDKEEEMHTAEIELGNHVGIVIGRKGATIISMQRSTGCKMYVDQVRRVLLIQGTEKQIDQIQKRVGALLDRVSNEEDRDHHGMESAGWGGCWVRKRLGVEP